MDRKLSRLGYHTKETNNGHTCADACIKSGNSIYSNSPNVELCGYALLYVYMSWISVSYSYS
jgi:hypothetical protein